MTITLYCLGCGFRLSVTMPATEGHGLTEELACGQCRSRRWATA